MRRERVVRRVEFVVPARDPWGATWSEVAKAVAAARGELVDSGALEPGRPVPEDVIAVRPGDDEVVVSYEVQRVVGSSVRVVDPVALAEFFRWLESVEGKTVVVDELPGVAASEMVAHARESLVAEMAERVRALLAGLDA